MKTKNLVAWISPLALALLAFGSQVAMAQQAQPVTREALRAEVLRAQKSGELERLVITSYSANPNWGPGAPANTSARALAEAARGDATRTASRDTAKPADRAL